jgi:hypothetical protein
VLLAQDPDHNTLRPGITRQIFYLGLATEVASFAAFLSKEAETLEVAEAVIDHAIDLAGRLMTLFTPVVATAAVVAPAMAAATTGALRRPEGAPR